MQILWNEVPTRKFKPTRDDLVIFCKVELEQAQVLNRIVARFCGYSGHKINAQKSNIFFSNGFGDALNNQFARSLGFKRFRILAHIWRCLFSTKRSPISYFGSICPYLNTLVQSILLSILNYFMQLLMIPKGTCTEIERMARQFIWGYSRG
ncbi:Retrovirus-related Pol polyprotein LINE-1 [Gossypium australe]|uniref:Retrovirus-related Pol polyprotein LINE-1 n=1 Tax=Gossypium australe TaxID=47621 RepID=A0A5B6WWC8_9ROSI|nr:Retrovirus-related Pol polyprotein LINE-1 [Gossypium australe]